MLWQLEQIKSQLTSLRKSNERSKQASLSDGSELQRVDRAIAKYRKQNKEMRGQLEGVGSRRPSPAHHPAPPKPHLGLRTARLSSQHQSQLEALKQVQSLVADLAVAGVLSDA